MQIFWRIIAIYLLLINLITFVVRGVDKWKAVKKKRRISEKTLLKLSIAGGFIGAVMAIETFRHKTVKGKFLKYFYLICGIWIVLLAVVYFYFG